MSSQKRVALVILDGWGETENSKHNAISKASTPNWDWLKQHATVGTLDASGQSVGLPHSQMGNSEVGHMHIGAGRIVNQDLTRISLACKNKELAQNKILNESVARTLQKKSTIHLIGLLSDGGVHSHQSHLFALLEYLKEQEAQEVYIHPFLDGRDTPPRSALESMERLEQEIKRIGLGKIASLSGRFYAMDRDNRWERIEQTYHTLCAASPSLLDAKKAINQAYDQGLSDEFVEPIALKDFQAIKDGDVVLCFNFRADRIRELSSALTEVNFNHFKRKAFPKIEYVSLTQYHPKLKASVLFPPQRLKNTLGEVISNHHLKQFRIAETEKYAHVTFFFNGGIDEPFHGETRTLIKSPSVKTYDLQPEMSAPKVSHQLSAAINKKEYAFLLCNFANPDMVGHTGNFEATVKAIEAVDRCLGEVIKACQRSKTELLITADHGNAETMFDETTKQAHTAHTNNRVPFIHLGRKSSLANDSPSLKDISPTVLSLLNLDIPSEITGHPIVELANEHIN